MRRIVWMCVGVLGCLAVGGGTAHADYQWISEVEVEWTIDPDHEIVGPVVCCAIAMVFGINFKERCDDCDNCYLDGYCLNLHHDADCNINGAFASAGQWDNHCGGGPGWCDFDCSHEGYAETLATTTSLRSAYGIQSCEWLCPCDMGAVGSVSCATSATCSFNVQPISPLAPPPLRSSAWTAEATVTFQEPSAPDEKLHRAVALIPGDGCGLWYNDRFCVSSNSNVAYEGSLGDEENLAFSVSDPNDTWIFVDLQTTVPADVSIARIVLVNAPDPAETGVIYFDDAHAGVSANPNDNLLINNSFETGSGVPDGWTALGEATKDCFNAHRTGYCSALTEGTTLAGMYQPISVTPSQNLYVSAWVQTPWFGPITGPATVAGVRVEWWNVDEAGWYGTLSTEGGAGETTISLDRADFDDARMDVSGYLSLDTEGRFNELDVAALETLLGSTTADDLDRWDFDASGVIDTADVDYLQRLVDEQFDSGVLGDLDADSALTCADVLLMVPFAEVVIGDPAYRIELDADLDGDMDATDEAAIMSHFSAKDCTGNGIPDQCEYLTGDADCNGEINFGEINAFVDYLTDPVAWQQAHPDCSPLVCDANCDCSADFDDINAFVDLLSDYEAWAQQYPDCAQP